MTLRLRRWPKLPCISECCDCMKDGLLMPVRICAGSLEVHEIGLCLACRLNWKDDARYCVLASTIEHRPRTKEAA